MPDQDKGKFSANIGDDVIKEALRSVEKHTTKPGAPPPSAEAASSASGEGALLDPEAGVLEGAPPGGPEGVPEADQQAAESPRDKELESLRIQLEFSQAKGRELMDKMKEEHERVLRATADLDNYRKRAVKEKDEVQRFGIEKLLRDFLPVLDNFDRALEHAKSASDFESLVKGIRMTKKIFEDALGRHGVKSFSAKGMAFDPRLHEAMQQVETSDMPPNHVYAEVLRGFTLNDRLVRPALVMVTKAKSPEAPEAEAEAGSPGPGAGGGDGGAS